MTGSRLRVLRLTLWLAGLLVVALTVQSVVVAHRIRIRGLPDGFPAPVAGADVPVLGVNVALEQYDDEDLEAALKRIAEGGFVWVRQSFYWSQVEPQPGRFDWTIPDRILAALARHPELRLVAVLDDSPPLLLADRSTVSEATLTAGPDGFAAFAGAFAARYGAQVDDYQVWDEPNLTDHWGGGPVNPPAYADLLACTARAIRSADPTARILLAGLAPTIETGPQNLSDVRYLEQLYQAGAAPYFDVVVGKPYGFDTGPDDRRADEAVLNFSRLLLLREVMVHHGDANKAVWASHWGWNALPPGWTGAPSIWGQTDERTQASRTVAALERARAEWPWAGALILDQFQPNAAPDDPRWGFALVGLDATPRPVYDAVAAWAAALPDAAPVGGYPALNPWATYEGGWRVGPLGADVGSDGDRATFRFEGPAIALTVRRGPYRAFLYVTVDGRPADALPRDRAGRAYVVLYDSVRAVATVPLASGLPSGPHTVEVVAEGGQGQWALVDWRVGPGPVHDGYAWKLAGLAAAGLALAALLVRDARRVDWAALGRRFLGWPEWAQVALVVVLAGLLCAAAGASWGRNLGSPWFVVSLVTLPVLASLFALRLDLGLALVAFSAPFYLHPGELLYRALSLPEVLVAVCGVGALVRGRQEAGGRKQEAGSRRQEARSRKQEAGSRRGEARGGDAAGQASRWSGGRVALTLLDLSVLLLMVAAVVAGVAAADRRAAVFELRAVFLLPALYYALLRLVRLDGRAWRRIVDGWVLGGVGVALVGLAQYALGRNLVVAEGGLPRLQSVYYSPNNVGLYLGRVWPLLVAVLLCGTRDRRRAVCALALVPVTLALGLSFSRGALLLGLPVALLVMGWRAGGRTRWLAPALVVVGALALIPLLRLPRFASMFDLQEGSTFFRLELWRSSLAMIREHPWFGVGPGNFLAAYRTRYVLPSAWQEFNLEHPHNVYLDHWMRLGLLGLLAGVAVQVAFWRAVRLSPSPAACGGTPSLSRGLGEGGGRGEGEGLRLGLTGSMAALLAHGLVDNTLFFPDLALTFFLVLALVQSSEISER
jgi:O-antigen ligase